MTSLSPFSIALIGLALGLALGAWTPWGTSLALLVAAVAGAGALTYLTWIALPRWRGVLTPFLARLGVRR